MYRGNVGRFQRVCEHGRAHAALRQGAQEFLARSRGNEVRRDQLQLLRGHAKNLLEARPEHGIVRRAPQDLCWIVAEHMGNDPLKWQLASEYSPDEVRVGERVDIRLRSLTP